MQEERRSLSSVSSTGKHQSVALASGQEKNISDNFICIFAYVSHFDKNMLLKKALSQAKVL